MTYEIMLKVVVNAADGEDLRLPTENMLAILKTSRAFPVAVSRSAPEFQAFVCMETEAPDPEDFVCRGFDTESAINALAAKLKTEIITRHSRLLPFIPSPIAGSIYRNPATAATTEPLETARPKTPKGLTLIRDSAWMSLSKIPRSKLRTLFLKHLSQPGDKLDKQEANRFVSQFLDGFPIERVRVGDLERLQAGIAKELGLRTTLGYA
jgi:hypothetical protein